MDYQCKVVELTIDSSTVLESVIIAVDEKATLVWYQLLLWAHCE